LLRCPLTFVAAAPPHPAIHPFPSTQPHYSAPASTHPFPSALRKACSSLGDATLSGCRDTIEPQFQTSAQSRLQPGPGLCAPVFLSRPALRATSHPEAPLE